MNPILGSYLRTYLSSLKEKDLWSLLVEFFQTLNFDAGIVHGTNEHGADILAHVPSSVDNLFRGYNVIIQAKTGNLTLTEWRNGVLGQIIEATYYPSSHSYFHSKRASRYMLILTGKLTSEARNSIDAFNLKRDITVEVYELNDLVKWFGVTPFGQFLYERNQGVGMPSLELEEIPPILGEENA